MALRFGRLLDELAQNELPNRYQSAVNDSFDRLVRVTGSVVERAKDDPALPGAVATDYLELVGHTIYAWLWARMVKAAEGGALEQPKRQVADYFFARLLPKALALESSIDADASAVMALPREAF